MTDEFLKADINGDGVISPEEFQLEIRRKRLEIEDADAQRDQIQTHGLVCVVRYAWLSFVRDWL
jgi:hypothetical protein